MDQDDRTAPPTERRRRQAREQGLGPRSHDLSLACRMLGFAAGLQFCGSNIVLGLADLTSQAFQAPLERQLTLASAVSRFSTAGSAITLNVIGLLAWIVGSGLIARLAQVGFRFDVAEIIPNSSRMNPVNGYSRIFRLENVYLLFLNLTKVSLLLGISGWYLWSRLGQLLALMENDVADSCVMIGSLLLSITWLVAMIQLVVGAGDFGWQYWKFEQSLRMTSEELRDER